MHLEGGGEAFLECMVGADKGAGCVGGDRFGSYDGVEVVGRAGMREEWFSAVGRH